MLLRAGWFDHAGPTDGCIGCPGGLYGSPGSPGYHGDPVKHPPHLPKSELKDGTYYEGSCRNSGIAAWDAEHQLFWYRRYKFGSFFTEDIRHPEDDNGFDLFYPTAECGEPADENRRVDLEKTKVDYRDLLRRRAEFAGSS